MANEDYAQKVKEALGNFPLDTSSLENLAKSQAALAEKLSAIAIEAAQRSNELSARWIQDTLSKLSAVTQAKAEPADYAKSMTDLVSGSADAATEHLAAFAEITKKVQADTLELLLSARKDLFESATVTEKPTTGAGGG